MARPKPVILVILDGWGENPGLEHNAIRQANTPTWDRLMREFPHGLVNASELHVGLPEGQMGNSEVGHMNIGAGRVVMQELPKIDQAIKDGSLVRNPKLLAFIAALKKSGGACHLMGLVSDGGVHSHQAHIKALAEMISRAGVEVKLHAFLDGRDTPPKSALEYLAQLGIEPVTVSGRYYAMDRDKRWDRIEKAYVALTEAKGERAKSAKEAVEQSYAKNLTDEFVLPTVIGDYKGIENGDGVLCANFRADRVRQILLPFLHMPGSAWEPAFIPRLAAVLGMTEYAVEMSPFMNVLFAPQQMNATLGEVVASAGLKQLRIAETEKYAHVTFFFNGGREQEFAGEERILVPSPKVATYDLKPEMSAPEVTNKLLAALPRFDLVVVNYANTDMVGHSGDIEAAKRAVEAVDTCLGRLVDAVLAADGALVITADHGNAECMFDHDSEQAHTAHTLNLVPSLVVANKYKGKSTSLPEGRLSDIAPTVLALMQIKQPPEMTGSSLIRDLA